MKVHLVVAHPEKNSFNFALHQTAIKALKNERITVNVTDLYTEKFNPAAGHCDVHNFPAEEYFSLAKAQRWALKNNAFVKTIKDEQGKLMSSDLLILQFPLWWWSFPAVLKGWIDRVLTSGFAYGKGSTLAPIKVMYSITTGGANNKEELEYYQNKIDVLYQDVFGFIGWEIVPAFIAHGVQQKTKDERTKILKDYKNHLIKQVVTSSLEPINA